MRRFQVVVSKYAFKLHRRRPMLSPPKTKAALAALTLFLLAVTLGLVRTTALESATVTVPTRKAATLFNEAQSPANLDMRAVGEPARLINAALPFANAPVQSAQPFVISGSVADKSLALRCLTQAVYYEAGYEPIEGRRAVAQVVLNRVRHPAFPKSVCAVVYQGADTGACQFTFVCDGKLSKAPALPAWRQAEAVARAALSGYVEDEVGEATHYHADYVMPRWAPLLSKVATIGQHIFYRWPGEWGDAPIFKGRYIGEPKDALTLRLAGSTFALEGVDEKPRAAPMLASPRIGYDIAALLTPSAPETTQVANSVELGAATVSSQGVEGRAAVMSQ